VALERLSLKALRWYVMNTERQTCVCHASREGWFGDTFVLPDESIGPNGGEPLEFKYGAGDSAHVTRAT
jgi:hypothetical protein